MNHKATLLPSAENMVEINSMEKTNDSIMEVLHSIFGFQSFRDNQKEIIQAILQGRDVFAALPTGGGKSLCYQLPAQLLPGMTVVISPLISLMKDQVDAAKETGIAASILNSSQTPEERFETYSALSNDKIKLLYISPERFALDSFEQMLSGIKVSLIAVDEAHCLSEWGHDFRPDYLSLRNLKTVFPDIPVAAFTATATKQVQQDIIRILKLKNTFIARASFNRKELFYKIVRKEKPLEQITAFIKERSGQSGIVYRTSRKDVESTVGFLKNYGIKAVAYHAGLRDELRKKNQDLFNRDEVDVVVATIAFGMGIDKSNIRYIIHGDLPKNIEGYYQETGRAGRDGEKADCILLFSRGDAAKINYFIRQMTEQKEIDKAVQNLNKMITFAGVNVCRRKQLLRYFDEDHPGDCNSCDVCSGQTELTDVSTDARKLLSAVVRTGERFGCLHVIDVVRGSQNAKIKKFGHDCIKTYGIGKDKSQKYWRALIDELIGQSCVIQDREKYNAIVLTDKGRQLLFGKIQLQMVRQPEETKTEVELFFEGKNEADYDPELFEQLKNLRIHLAREKNIPPYIVFSDKALHQMSAFHPATPEEFLQINGVGEKKAEVYGDIFLHEIRAFLANKRQKF